MSSQKEYGNHTLTSVDESAGSTFAELFGFVGESYFNNSWNVPWWCLNSDGVGRYQLQKSYRKHTLNQDGTDKADASQFTQSQKGLSMVLLVSKLSLRAVMLEDMGSTRFF